MNTARKLVLAASALLAAYSLVRCTGLTGPDASDKGEDPALLVDRLWVDSEQEKLTDYVHASLFAGRQPFGAFQKASAYDIHLELFRYKRDGTTIEVTFPQTKRTANIRFSISSCNDLPPFDLCLDLSENPWGGPKRYHGMREQEDGAKKLGPARAGLLERAREAVRTGAQPH